MSKSFQRFDHELDQKLKFLDYLTKSLKWQDEPDPSELQNIVSGLIDCVSSLTEEIRIYARAKEGFAEGGSIG